MYGVVKNEKLRLIMKTTVLLSLIIFSTALSYGEGRAEKMAREKTEALNKQTGDQIEIAAKLSGDLKHYGISSKAFNDATNTLVQLVSDRVWKDLASRETRTHENARDQIQRRLKNIEMCLRIARNSVEKTKKDEYEQWARNHPQEARAREIQDLRQTAEDASVNAQMQAQHQQAVTRIAHEEAAQARLASQNAEARALRAQRQARENQNRADDAEQDLRRHGLPVR